MTQPFEGPPEGPPAAGFGFTPFDHQARRAMHQARREAHREMRGFFKDHASNHAGGFGIGFGPGFGPGGPGGFGFGFGPGRGRGGRRGRGRRGDVRAAILVLLSERPMHGYEMIQEISNRSEGLWRPSPGSVYPTLQLLVDEGLIVATESEGSRKLFDLTDDGRTAAELIATPPWEEIAEGVDPAEVNLRVAFGQFAVALFQAAHATTPEQQKRLVELINNARREVYGILSETE